VGCNGQGQVHNRGPFLNANDDCGTMDWLDKFMIDVPIPLASDTHAVILCYAMLQACDLTKNLLKMVKLCHVKWSGEVHSVLFAFILRHWISTPTPIFQ